MIRRHNDEDSSICISCIGQSEASTDLGKAAFTSSPTDPPTVRGGLGLAREGEEALESSLSATAATRHTEVLGKQRCQRALPQVILHYGDDHGT